MMEKRIDALFAAVYPALTGETDEKPELPGGIKVQDALSLLPGMRLEEAAYRARLSAAREFDASAEDGVLLHLVERHEELTAYLCRESFRYGYKIGQSEGRTRSV